ncbi:MAG: histidine--tRNA ligase [candidate division Zixibacteria bacterium]|nr:histidine--tRNA ligase [candidate division Zixibacteria bacterium]
MSEKKKKDKVRKVRPELLKGFRDTSPPQQAARQAMLYTIGETLERFGFLPLQTPALERCEVLLGQEEGRDVFQFDGPDETRMALRFDLTVSLARYVAANPELPLPFKRYQFGNVWRIDKPGPGRYREFMQFDLDIVGSNSILADAEVMAGIVSVLQALGIENYRLSFSSRKILTGLLESSEIDSGKIAGTLRAIDKLHSIGLAETLKELDKGRVDKSGDKISGVGLSSSQIGAIESFLSAASEQLSSRGEIEDSLFETVKKTQTGKDGLEEIRGLKEALGHYGIRGSALVFDPTIVRGLGYYTGPVFETFLTDLPQIGSIFSGGRYDHLVSRFSGKKISGVGASVGVDRLLTALGQLGEATPDESICKVLVATMDPELMDSYVDIARELRQAGINTELYVGDSRSLSKQLRYGDRRGVKLAVIAGSNEIESGKLTIKNLAVGREKSAALKNREEWLRAGEIQVEIDRDQLVETILAGLRA